MTSAERPTQEVAPRQEVNEAADDLRQILDYPNRLLLDQALIFAHEHGRAEASRSAPPAAVTAEQLAVALPSGWTAITTKEQRQRFAQLILSKITPAQPSASSEGDGGWFDPITGDGYAPDQPLPSGDPYLREIETRLTNALNADPFESDPLWRLRDDLRKRLAAKPTGSADEPHEGQPHICRRCGFEGEPLELRAALASAEPAEVDGDE